ncbi:hypothetical protein DL98DRAFT_483677, partial [Cadophora sp. DSE1049]
MKPEDSYVLGRDASDSIRLDAQHLLWRMHLGYLLHPGIPITRGMKIAERGTGTGTWLFDASRSLPSDVVLHGYDILGNQFPAKELWPENISLGLLDSLIDPPAAFADQYDVVHLRMWASNLKENNTTPLLQPIMLLLNADLVHQVVGGQGAQDFEGTINAIFEKAGLKYDWVSELSTRLPQQGFEVIKTANTGFQHDLIQLCTSTYLMATLEILRGINLNTGLSITKHEDALKELLKNCRGGFVYNWGAVTVLGRK